MEESDAADYNVSKKPRLDESVASGSETRVCPFKQQSNDFVVVRSRVEEPGCDIGTNERTFQVLDEVGSDSEENGDGESLSQEEEFGKCC